MDYEDDAGDNVYEQANEELLRFIDNHGSSNHIGGAGYFDVQRERRNLFVLRADVEFLQNLAGALDLSSIEELYDKDDVDISLRQAQMRSERLSERSRKSGARREKETTETRQMKDELHRLRGEALRVETSERVRLVDELAGIGHRLVARFVVLMGLRLDLELLADGHSLPEDKLAHHSRQRTAQFRLTHDNSGTDSDADSLVPLVLFELYLDNKRRQTLCHLLREDEETRDERLAIFTARTVLMPGSVAAAATTTTTIDETECERLPVVDGLDWSLLADTETVVLPLLLQLYDETRGLRDMATHGCRMAYASHPNPSTETDYVTMVTRFIFADSAEEIRQSKQDLSQRLDIFYATVDGQPTKVAELLARFTRPSEVAAIKTLLTAHFMWCYFQRASLQRLASDWHRYGVKPTPASLLHRTALVRALDLVKATLAEYFSLVLFLLFDAGSPLLTSVADRPLFQLTVRLRTYDYARPTGLDEPQRLDHLNRLFSATTSTTTVGDLVLDPILRQSLALDQSSALGYPALGLDQLLPLYRHTMAEYSVSLRQRITDLERDIEQLDSRETIVIDEDPEETRLALVEEAAVEGERLRLKPVYDYAMRLAHIKVTRQCPGLKTLTLAQLQSDKARASGLQLEFTHFLAAMIREQNLVTKKKTTSKHQRVTAMRGTWEVMQLLKQYSVQKQGRYSFKITRAHGRMTLF